MEMNQFVEKYSINRFGTNSLKWDALQQRFGDPDLISMWVADMEFRTPECVVEALKNRVEHGIYGYSYIPDSYYEAVQAWEYKHHGYKVEKEWMRVTPGIVSAIYWSVNMYTQPDDAIVIVTPVYYPFHNAVKDSGRKLVTVDMDYDKGVFTLDFDKFEKAIVENNVKMYIMCSPHNPAGRVWKQEELEKMLEICHRHNVVVFSDEIHQDLVFGETKHTPSATVAGGKYAKNMITAFASSKTFNLATCLTSTIVIEDEEMRKTWDKFTNIYHNVEVNIFGIAAVEAALRGGEEWYNDVKKVMYSNYQMVVEEMKEFPGINIAPMEGTYLVLMDLRNYIKPEETKDFIQGKCRIAVDYGEWFGANWAGFIRLNMATDPAIVKQAMANIKANLKELAK